MNKTEHPLLPDESNSAEGFERSQFSSGLASVSGPFSSRNGKMGSSGGVADKDNSRASLSSPVPVSLPANHPVNLGAALERAAKDHPTHDVGYLDGDGRCRRQSYPELLAASARVLAGLRATGLSPGKMVIFQLEDNLEFITAFWACAIGGFVPVPMPISPTFEQPHRMLSKLENAWSMLNAPLVLAGAALSPKLRTWANLTGLKGFRAETIDAMKDNAPARNWHPSEPSDLAVLLLTSGSTGAPKAVRQTHGSLLAWAASVAQACEFTADDISLNWMPLDHVGGLVMFHVRDVVIGCRQLHAPTDVVLQRPFLWLDWIESYRATITWAPNFAFGLINEQSSELAQRRWNLSSMRFILNGGEAIVSKTARRFLELLAPHGLPGTAMRPAWGMSETSSGVTYSTRFTLLETSDADPFVEVGEPIPGVQIRIVDSEDVPVPEGKTGHLQIRGISVTEGYFQNEEATRSSFTLDGWFITGDLGVIRSGRLTITGREKDVIIVNGANFYCHELESIVEEVEGVEKSFTAACAIRLAAENTDRVAIFFCPGPTAGRSSAGLIQAIRAAVVSKGGVAPDFILPLRKSDIPKTSIGKIQRSLLKELFESGKFDGAFGANHGQNNPRLLFKAWRETPPPEKSGLSKGSRVLIFSDSSGLGSRLARLLSEDGHRTVTVSAGSDFAERGTAHFQINPDDPSHYKLLFDALGSLEFAPSHVVHAWTYPPAAKEPGSMAEIEAAQAKGSLSLLRLLQAWPNSSEDAAPVYLLVASSRLQTVADLESVDFAKAPILGIIRTIPHEFAWLECGHVDFLGTDPAFDVARVERELASGATGEIAWRDGRRFTPVLRILPESDEVPPVFNTGEVFVLSGGLGGIGRLLAQRLVKCHGARVLVLGRFERPEGELNGGGWSALDELGQDALYAAGDLNDPSYIRTAIARAAKCWGRTPSGVIHLAGAFHEQLLVDETEKGFLGALRPKLQGAWALDQAAREHPDCRFVHFSSLMGHFSARANGAYAAANSSLDAFAHHQRNRGTRSCCLLWTLWSNTGMGNIGIGDEILRSQGFVRLHPEKALDLLERALATDREQIFIGLDPTNRALLRHLDSVETSAANAVAEHIPPRTDLEKKIARIWEDVLSVPRVGLRDNFFELGGRSLLAARVFARVERELGRKMPLATLFHAPTVEALAALLEIGAPAGNSRILAIQTDGSLPPFFCIPGGGSDVIVFRDLSRALGSEQPFYGLQARGLDATPIEGACPSVEQVAAGFVRAIREIQPVGPYQIGGHCFGSLMAWEVACQLSDAGQQVGSLALLDPTVSNVFSGEILGSQRLRYHFGKFMRMSPLGKCRYFLSRFRNFSRTLVVRRRISQSYETALAMHARYSLRPYSGDVTVFMAEDSFFKLSPEKDPRRYYEKIAQGKVTYIEIPGDHHEILHYPDVIRLASGLKGFLERASPHQSAPPS